MGSSKTKALKASSSKTIKNIAGFEKFKA